MSLLAPSLRSRDKRKSPELPAASVTKREKFTCGVRMLSLELQKSLTHERPRKLPQHFEAHLGHY